MWIEFAGSVGAGKSSLAAGLRERLRQAGLITLTPQEALHRYAQTFAMRVWPLDTREEQAFRLINKAVNRAMLAGGQTRFALKHPALIRQVIASERARRSLPLWHRRIIWALFFEVAGWYNLLSSQSAQGELVVLDEGLVHRSVNLYAWEPGELDPQPICRYFERLPPISLTVVVRAPLDICLERSLRRGLPLRLRGKNPTQVQRFIANSADIAAQMSPVLQAIRQPVVEITNAGGLDQAINELMDQVIKRYPAIHPVMPSLRTEYRNKDRSE